MDPLAAKDVAVVGLAGRFAAAETISAYLQATLAGETLLSSAPPNRFAWPTPAAGAALQQRGGFLSSVDRFDAALFGVNAREAARMDPQMRLLLETTRAAMEDAGYAP